MRCVEEIYDERKAMRRRTFCALLGLIGSVFSRSAGTQNSMRLNIGDECPGFFTKLIDGGNFFLNEYVGENAKRNIKGILFCFCSYTCKPCRNEIPELGKLYERYRDMGLEIFLVDVGDPEDVARKLIKEVGTGLPLMLDRYQVVAKRLGVTATPYNILLDGSGIVRFIHTGFGEDKTAEFIELLEKNIVAMLS